MVINIKFYDELNSLEKINLFYLYQSKLSMFNECYTDIGEIIFNLHNDENFYVIGCFDDSNILGYLQFKYFPVNNFIFIDYICLKTNLVNSKLVYKNIEETIYNKFKCNFICTEFTFSNKKRITSLSKLYNKYNFIDSNINYIQPPTIGFIPTIGKIYVKKYNDLNIKWDDIIKDIYFNHYGYWYQYKKYYNILLKIIWKFQKIRIIYG